MQSQRPMVVASLLTPNHGVYPVRLPEVREEPKVSKGGEKWPSPPVMDEDHGEW